LARGLVERQDAASFSSTSADITRKGMLAFSGQKLALPVR
jgi:hypothetical protein